MATATAAGDETLIKKYSNRRLYDTRRSRYITLEDLAGMIRDGATVKVVDANKGSDLTRLVLTQVILEEQDRLDLLPVDLLHHIIKVQGTMMQGPFAAFLSMAIKQFLSTGQAWERQMSGMLDGWPMFPGMPGFGGGTATSPPPAASAPPGPEPAEEATPDGGGSDEALGQLRSRMDDLLAQLNRTRK
jgi:polyhydroxyalkanoate synthesis repressor PhaR